MTASGVYLIKLGYDEYGQIKSVLRNTFGNDYDPIKITQRHLEQKGCLSEINNYKKRSIKYVSYGILLGFAGLNTLAMVFQANDPTAF